jgi:hypothetical protein
MNLFRNAIIPSSSSLGSAAGARPKSPPPVPPPRKSQSFFWLVLLCLIWLQAADLLQIIVLTKGREVEVAVAEGGTK